MDEAKTNIILNEDYKDNKILFDKGEGDKIFFKNKAYIDLSNCAGSLILGHNSNIFKKSLKLYLNKKISIFAHPNTHAINFSKNIKKNFPSFSRIIFCNSGAEAVLKSLRISKSLNKKKLTVNVTGSWHGSVDQLLFYPNKYLKPQKLSDGLSLDDKKKLIYIPYNDIEKSSKILNKFKNDINCIIIEPIQACLPLGNTKNYLKFLENFCNKNNITLIFDELITGIRIRPGTIQEKYNINADITTIGKVLGGGLSIAVIGITEKINKIIKKKKIKVFFGGTFSGNSLTSFVGNETLKFLFKNKRLFSNLNKKCFYFQKSLNQFIIKERIKAKVYRFDSILRIVFSKNEIKNRIQRDFFEKKNIPNIAKFRQYLLENSIYYPSNGVIFLSNSTSYKSINYVLKYIKFGLKKFF